MVAVKKNRPTGFTLIEVLIVVLIISIAVTFASLSISSYHRQARTVAEDLAAIIRVAEQQAILQPTTLGLFIDANGYTFYEWINSQNTTNGSWQALTKDRVLGPKKFPSEIAVTLENTNKATTEPQIILLPSGDLTPFTITIGDKNKPPSYEITGESNGSVQLTDLKANNETK